MIRGGPAMIRGGPAGYMVALPSLGVAQPSVGVAQPCLGVAQPCLGVAQPCLGVAQPRKVVGGWPSRLYGGPAGYMVGLGKILVSAPVPLYLIGPFNWGRPGT